ncbi:MAG: hypothetical protein ACC661_08030 [Verrucomicrobiales bacterium]
MPIPKLLLLNVLIIVIGVSAFLLYRSFQASPTPAGDEPAQAEVSGELGQEAADLGQDAVAEAESLVGAKLVLFLLGGVAAGILALVYVVPKFGDMVGDFFYSAPEEAEAEPASLAVAKIAQGDYEGAAQEYLKLIEENPQDRFPVVEIAKLYLDKMNDPDRAVTFLEESLDDKEWPVDDAAFLMFRTIDIELEGRQNPIRARELLVLVTENFEGSRHAANAQHKIHAIDNGSWARK